MSLHPSLFRLQGLHSPWANLSVHTLGLYLLYHQFGPFGKKTQFLTASV